MLHPPLRVAQPDEAKLFIELVSISRRQQPTSQPLQFRVADNCLHQPFAQTLPAKLLDYENVADVGKCGMVADHPGKTDLPLLAINAETNRMRNRFTHLLRRKLLCPVRLAGKIAVDHVKLKSGLIGADQIFTFRYLNHFKRIVSVYQETREPRGGFSKQ